jgi:hypothetical protein
MVTPSVRELRMDIKGMPPSETIFITSWSSGPINAQFPSSGHSFIQWKHW